MLCFKNCQTDFDNVETHRLTIIPVKEGSEDAIAEIANSDEFKDKVKAFQGFLGVQTFKVEGKIFSHSKWDCKDNCLAADMKKVLAGKAMEHVSGPPTPYVGPIEYFFDGKEKGNKEAGAARIVIMTLKPKMVKKMARTMMTKENVFQELEGLISIEAIKHDDEKVVVVAKYDSKESLDKATPKIGEVMKSAADMFAGPPQAYEAVHGFDISSTAD